MFEDLNLHIMHDENGQAYVSVVDLALHLHGSVQDLHSIATAKIESGELSTEQIYYVQGGLDAMHEMARFLAEANLTDSFSQELSSL